MIDSLWRKPGAFANHRYRRALLPRAVFRQAYDALAPRASRDYLELLALDAALGAALCQGELSFPAPIAEALARTQGEPPSPPSLSALAPERAERDPSFPPRCPCMTLLSATETEP